ncbi:MAG TPA: hypothetical protein VGO67_18450 [Verrucomicrobiae bacterium]
MKKRSTDRLENSGPQVNTQTQNSPAGEASPQSAMDAFEAQTRQVVKMFGDANKSAKGIENIRTLNNLERAVHDLAEKALAATDQPVADAKAFYNQIQGALKEIDTQISDDATDMEKMKLLAIRQYLSESVDAVETPIPIATPAPPQPTVAVDPFPVHEDPQDVQGPRFHIRDSYVAALKMQHEDGFSSLVNLWECIEHHPRLQTETDALEKLVQGSNALCELSSRHFSATECTEDLTGGEVWLVNQLHAMDRSVTIEGYLLKLSQAPERLRKNPKTAELAEMIHGMFEARQTMWKLTTWLLSL